MTTAKSLIATAGGIQALSATAGNIQAFGNSSIIRGIATQAGPPAGELLADGLQGLQTLLPGTAYTIGSGTSLDCSNAANVSFTFNYVALQAMTVTIAGALCDGVIAGGGSSAVGFTVPALEPFNISMYCWTFCTSCCFRRRCFGLW